MNIHIPTYEEVSFRYSNGENLNPLDAFIFDYEPVEKTEAFDFRADLHSLIEYVLRKEGK